MLKLNTKISNQTFGLLMTIPALIILILFFVYPLIYSFYMSLHEFSLMRPDTIHFVGLQNYIHLLANNGEFLNALRNTILYTIIAIPFEFVFGLIIAILLTNITRGQNLIRMFLILPMMLAPVAMGLMWKFMYNDQIGIINHLLRLMGVTNPPYWLADPNLALYSIIAVDIWATTPFMAILLLAGLLSISHELYEAAMIDGAGKLQTFWFITWPLLRPIALVALLLRGMDAFRVYDIVYTLTKGGPANRTDVLSLFAYRTTFVSGDVGVGSAASFIMLAILITISILLINAMRGGASKS